MKKIALFFSALVIVGGCGDGPKNKAEHPPIASPDLALDEKTVETFAPLNFVDAKLDILHEGVMTLGAMVVNLSCDNVYGTGNGDWTMNNVSTTSGSTVSIIAGTTCHITLVSYSDATNTYTAVTTSLVINISSTGTVSNAAAVEYTSGGGSPVLQWFAAAQGASPYTVIINYAADAITVDTSPTITNLTGHTVTLTVAQIPAPVVSSLILYFTPALNGAAASYTLTAAVTGSTSCKYIDNSAGTYTPTSWASVNTAFNAAGAQPCPQFVDGATGFTPGNWTAFWVAGTKILIMWADTVNGLSSYATANIGP
jgi:hypothetical protein